MKRKSINEEIRSAKISTVINLIFRIVIICLWCGKYEQFIDNEYINIAIYFVMLVLALQCLFLPYLTMMRIKEIRKGEIYEASKY